MIGVGAAGPLGRDRRPHGGRATEREYWIALSRCAGIGPVSFARLIRAHGSAAAAWAAGPGGLAAAGPAPADTVAAFAEMTRRDPRELARRVVRATEAAGGRVLTPLDDAYPGTLLTIDPRPPVLYVAGDVNAFTRRAVAIVGTRRASGYGLAVAFEIASDLADAGVVIVSGLALGIDGAAHRGAVEAGKPTIAVLPSPLDRIYPPRHRPFAQRILAAGGALVTEVPPGAALGKPDFARRNRVIAGLGEAGVVVVEAPDESGALLTAAAAAAIGRDLYAVPGPITAMASRGANRLIADQQATIVTSTGALLQRIGLPRAGRPATVQALSEVEGQTLRRLLERSGSIEELVDRMGHPPAAIASALTLLEARGLVNSFGGATFHPTLAARRLAGFV